MGSRQAFPGNGTHQPKQGSSDGDMTAGHLPLSYPSQQWAKYKGERARHFATAILFLGTCCCLLVSPGGAQVKEVRRVLIFNELGLGSPGVAAISKELVSALEKSHYQIEFYSESLDTPLFPDETSQRQFREWFLGKYRARKPDVIVALGPSPIKFMKRCGCGTARSPLPSEFAQLDAGISARRYWSLQSQSGSCNATVRSGRSGLGC